MGDLDIHGAAAGDGLEIFRSHHAAHAGPAAGVLYAGHHVGEGHQVFPGRPDHHALDLLVVQFVPDGPLAVGDALPPDVRRITDFDFTVVDEQVNRLFGFSLDDQMMKTGPCHLRGEEPAHVGASQQAGERGLGHDVGSGGCRCAGGGQDTAADDQRVVWPDRITALGGVIVEQVCIQAPAPEKFSSYIHRYGLGFDNRRWSG